MIQSIKIYGDQALLVNFEQRIDPAINAAVIALQNAIEQAQIDGVTFQIPAYCSLTVGYDPSKIEFAVLSEVVRQIGAGLVERASACPVTKALAFDPSCGGKSKDLLTGRTKVSRNGFGTSCSTSRLLRIPVCYEPPYALDLEDLSTQKGISQEDIINLHTSQTFKVYMLGFLPGFVFMGKLPNALQCNRKVTPRLRVPPSSVGIAGLQTGIYPTESPGGWQIIGRTPLTIFDPKKEQPFYFRAGDEVQFYAISKEEFLAYA
ncbi:MAG: 5-oxoprolinase subunit PxpB [Bacteroidota bacterium]